MPSIQDSKQAVSLDSSALREIGEALSALASPLADRIETPDWDQKLEQVGPQLVSVERVRYQVDSRTVDDGETAPFDATSFSAWPPASATSAATSFHVFMPSKHPGYEFLEIPYVQVESSDYGWVSVQAWAPSAPVATSLMDTVFSVLEKHEKKTLPESDSPLRAVFVGHGGDRQWEVVRDYLQSSQYRVEAFETDERAGFNTLDVVSQMIHASDVAVIVMTAADKLADGSMLARQNVIHEIGFAQGVIGVPNTIILLEEGVKEFTNIAGLTQVRFQRGEIHTTKTRVMKAVDARASRGC
jgi:hypothetical protein